jgi:hypothetical protein
VRAIRKNLNQIGHFKLRRLCMIDQALLPLAAGAGDEINQHSILDENTLRFEMAAFITTTNDKFEALIK